MTTIPKWLVPAAFLFGIAFLVAILALVVKIPGPTPTQFTVFRIIIALGGAAFSMALTGFLTIQLNLPKGGQIVAGGALAVFVVLYFYSPAIPGIPKPLVDERGNPLLSPANDAERQVIRLKNEIGDLRQFLVSVQSYPSARQELEKAIPLAEGILSFNDSSLSPRRRYIKYEYATYAYVDAAAGAMYDNDRAKVEEYASQAMKTADTALSMLDAAEHTYESADSRFLTDWVVSDDGKDRVLYLRAMAACMLGSMRSDSKLKSEASDDWKKVHKSYQDAYPLTGTPELNSCVNSA